MTCIELTRDQSKYLIDIFNFRFHPRLWFWMQENMKSNTKAICTKYPDTFEIGFEDEHDAILFKMRWL